MYKTIYKHLINSNTLVAISNTTAPMNTISAFNGRNRIILCPPNPTGIVALVIVDSFSINLSNVKAIGHFPYLSTSLIYIVLRV